MLEISFYTEKIKKWKGDWEGLMEEIKSIIELCDYCRTDSTKGDK